MHRIRELRLEGVIALMLHRQHLDGGSRADQLLPVVDDLLGLHGTVPLSPYLQLRARIPTFARDQLDVLLDEGRVAKLACMRRTVFIESSDLAPIVFAATRRLTVRDRERLLAAYGLTWRGYEEIAERVEGELAGRALDARELRDALGVTQRLSPILIVMCDEGRLVRWKGRGGWQSAQPRYRRFEEALPDVRWDRLDERTAVRELVDRYVRRYGPVSEDDIGWWTGLGKTIVRDAVAAVPDVASVEVDGLRGVHLMHEADIALARSARPAGQISLLPVLDPYLQSYRGRERCIDPRHQQFVIDSGGNATSVILVNGHAAGVWDFVADPAPELRLCFLRSPDARTRSRVRRLAADLAAFLTGDGARVTEHERMTPLTDRSAGRFLSPLKDLP